MSQYAITMSSTISLPELVGTHSDDIDSVLRNHPLDHRRLAQRHLLQILVELALHAVLHRFEHVVNCHLRIECRLRACLEDACPDQDRIPGIFCLATLVELVRAPNVRLRRVANKVHRVGRLIDAVSVFPPLLQQAGRELKRTQLRLAESDGLELLASDGFEHGFEGGTESAHADAAEAVVSGPDDVVVREEDGWALVEGLGASSQDSVLAHAEVEDDLLVAGPVAGVGKDEDGFDLDLTVVSQLGV